MLISYVLGSLFFAEVQGGGGGGGAASEINNCYQRTGEEKGKRSGISGPPRALFPFFASLEVCGEESARFTHTS